MDGNLVTGQNPQSAMERRVKLFMSSRGGFRGRVHSALDVSLVHGGISWPTQSRDTRAVPKYSDCHCQLPHADGTWTASGSAHDTMQGRGSSFLMAYLASYSLHSCTRRDQGNVLCAQPSSPVSILSDRTLYLWRSLAGVRCKRYQQQPVTQVCEIGNKKPMWAACGRLDPLWKRQGRQALDSPTA